ncbi:MAG TPA: hypothetical protein DCP51_02725 [Clostridiales bacterium]|nr:hypothetical protein [Clostridiales bacterium]
MTNIIQISEVFAGLRSIKIYKTSDIVAFGDVINGVVQGISASDYTEIQFSQGAGNYEHESKNNKYLINESGFSVFVPGNDIDQILQLINLDNERFVVVFTDRNGTEWIAGTIDNPLRLTDKYSTGKSPSDKSGREFIISGNQLKTIYSFTQVDSFQLDFYVFDIIGDVENALITIGTLSILTNSDGCAIFNIYEGTYNYMISKIGYLDSVGSVVISGSNVSEEVEMNGSCEITFHAEYNSQNLENILITIKDITNTNTIDSGYTDVDGDYSVTLYDDIYYIIVGELQWDLKCTNHFITAPVPSYTDNLIIIQKDLCAVTFAVKDSSNSPIIGAEIGGAFFVLYNDLDSYFGHQDHILITNSNGEVTVNEISGDYTFEIKKSGYSFANPGSVLVNTSENETMTVNIVMT